MMLDAGYWMLDSEYQKLLIQHRASSIQYRVSSCNVERCTIYKVREIKKMTNDGGITQDVVPEFRLFSKYC